MIHCMFLSSYDGLELWQALALGSPLLTMLLLRSRMLDTCFCTYECHCTASWRVSKPSVKEVYPRVASQLVGQWMVTQNCTRNDADGHEVQYACGQAYCSDRAELFSTVD
jgi:hypothetical protein